MCDKCTAAYQQMDDADKVLIEYLAGIGGVVMGVGLMASALDKLIEADTLADTLGTAHIGALVAFKATFEALKVTGNPLCQRIIDKIGLTEEEAKGTHSIYTGVVQ